jgi:transposase InsO family protein
MMYPLVRELAVDGIPVAVTCRVLNLSRQPYYRWLAGPVTDADWVAAHRANALFDAHRDDPEFGYRYLLDEARDAGVPMAARTAWRICSDNGWWSAFGKKRAKNGKKPGPPVHDDLCAVTDEKGRVRHEFEADAANELWIGDISEHWTGEGKLYVCAFKDVWSNRIVGYSIDSRMKSRLAVATLNNAIARRGDVAGCVVHTDRGSQFRSRKFVRALGRHEMVGSMGRVGAAGDNAAMEMLLSASSRHRSGFQQPEEVSGVVALEAAHRLTLGFALGDPAGEVGLGRRVVLDARQDGGVQCSVELAVAAA